VSGFNCVDSGLQDVGAGRAIKGQPNAGPIKHDRQFVLGSRQGKSQTVSARQHGATRQFIQDGSIGTKFMKLKGRMLNGQVDIEACEESCLATSTNTSTDHVSAG